MNYQIEVCIDNLESLYLAIAGGATRIELCSSLTLGGLTPSFGMMQQAAKQSSVPIYAMIRPRQGDFLYDDDDIAMMASDIQAAATANLQGVVLGLLTADGEIDVVRAKPLIDLAHQLGLGVTFHRAIDQSRDALKSLEQVIELGCERVLTSGLAADVVSGIETLKQMQSLAAGRITIMAGAGLNAQNVAQIVTQCAIREVHLSGKTSRPSLMNKAANQAHMGSKNVNDFVVPITSSAAIQSVVDALQALK
ncbi:copper homeostasis protein [Vibrio xiamenensis]|uniref:PF03932 family protein CutC n=1 Tax=Vibrio xiamenensis TaxID=861298 RepID=A0A1G7W4F0_9VIBR|nr:copper homeostasis protein CutC [Vibrio xiamenensis]SDG66882.1 copper homeostasis protein [Vibrio xiamenensis]